MSEGGDPTVSPHTEPVCRRWTDRSRTLVVRTIAEQGTLRFCVIPEDGVVTVGRDPDCDLALPEEGTLSRMHARFRSEAGSLILEDLSSTNGTFLGDERVHRCVVRRGDRVTVGDVVLRVEEVGHAELQQYQRATERLDKADRDPLTGLHNRTWLDDALPSVVRRCEKAKSPLSLMMIDVDHFKRVNDTWGHLAGDAVLRRLGDTLISHLRRSDSTVRFGGEEFLAILPDAHEEQAAWVAERVRRAVRRLDFRAEVGSRNLVRVTVSIGIAECGYDDPLDAVQAADRALYLAKAEGRDCCMCASEVEEPEPGPLVA